MLVKQWTKHYKAICARRAKMWASIKSVSEIMDCYHPKMVIRHIGKSY